MNNIGNDMISFQFVTKFW